MSQAADFEELLSWKIEQIRQLAPFIDGRISRRSFEVKSKLYKPAVV